MLGQAKKVLQTTYARIAGISFMSVLIGTLVNTAATKGVIYTTPGLTEYLNFNPTSITEMSLPTIELSGLGISIIILTALLLFLITIITAVAGAAVIVKNESFTKAITFAATKGLRSIPVQILFILLMVVGSIPGILITTIGAVSGSILLVLLGALLLILILFTLLVRSMFFMFIWVEDQKERAWFIIKQSFTLTRGSIGWMIVLFLIIAIIAIIIIHPILLLLLSIPTKALLTHEATSALTDHLISILLMIPITYAITYTLYVRAKERTKNITKKNT